MENETTRRITPTGRLVLSVDAPRDEWLGERTKGITATDIAAIMGASKYKTAIDVWNEKLNGRADNFEPTIGSNEAAFWGIALEDVVASKWAEHKGVTIRRIGIIEHEGEPWMRASLDRLVHGCMAGRCALEVKTRSGYVGPEWDRHVPDDVELQVLWQLMVSGLDHVHVIALIGGQRLVEHVVSLEGYDTDKLRDAAYTVWQAVQEGEAPLMPEALWTQEYLTQLHEAREGQVELDNASLVVLANYRAVCEQIKTLEAKQVELRTALIGAMGDAEVAVANGNELYSYRSSATKRLNSKALAQLHPDVAADPNIYTTSITRTFRVKGNTHE